MLTQNRAKCFRIGALDQRCCHEAAGWSLFALINIKNMNYLEKNFIRNCAYLSWVVVGYHLKRLTSPTADNGYLIFSKHFVF